MFNDMTLTFTGRIGVTTLQTNRERSIMKLNKELQMKILEECEKARPNRIILGKRIETEFGGMDAFIAEVQYLQDIGLITGVNISYGVNDIVVNGVPRITTKGMNYLSKEETIWDELNVVTIKIHEDTIKKMIELKIDSSDLSPSHKKKLLDRLRELPASAIERLVFQLVDKGLENTPALLQMLKNSLG